MKPFYQSKTLWFNLLTILVAVAALFGWDTFEPSATTQEIVLLAVGVINLILRLLTKSEIA
jgi:hypothetical protein